MEAFGDTGIMFDASQLTEDYIRLITDHSDATPLPEANPKGADEPEPTIETIMDGVWQDALDDPDMRAQIENSDLTKQDCITDFKQRVADDPEELNITKFPYTVTETADGYSHRLERAEILWIPKTYPNAELTSKKADFIAAAAVVFFDFIALVFAALNLGAAIYAVRNPVIVELIVKDGGVIVKLSPRIFDATRAGTLTQKILLLTRVVKATDISFKSIIKRAFSKIKGYKLVKLIIEVTAGIGLLLASGGTSLVAKAVEMASWGTMFAIDTSDCVDMYNRWKGK